MKFIHVFWLVFAVFLWGFIHSVTASLQFKALIRRVFGVRVDRYYRLTYNVIAVATLFGVLLVAVSTPDTTIYVVPFPWVAILIILEFFAVAALIIGLWQTDALDFLGVRQVFGGKKRQPSTLIKDGLYRYVRHPLYSAGIIFIWSLPLMTARLLILNLALTTYVVAGAYYEERKLKLKFGQEYIEYSRVTPMFVPFLKRGLKKTSQAGLHGKV